MPGCTELDLGATVRDTAQGQYANHGARILKDPASSAETAAFHSSDETTNRPELGRVFKG